MQGCSSTATFGTCISKRRISLSDVGRIGVVGAQSIRVKLSISVRFQRPDIHSIQRRSWISFPLSTYSLTSRASGIFLRLQHGKSPSAPTGIRTGDGFSRKNSWVPCVASLRTQFVRRPQSASVSQVLELLPAQRFSVNCSFFIIFQPLRYPDRKSTSIERYSPHICLDSKSLELTCVCREHAPQIGRIVRQFKHHPIPLLLHDNRSI